MSHAEEMPATERELRKTQEFLQGVIDASADAIIACDVDARVTLWSRAAERVLGVASAAAIGTDIRHFFAAGEAERILRHIREGRIERLPTELRTMSGEPVPVLLSGGLMSNDDKEVTGAVGVFTDTRERVAIERELQSVREQLLAQERESLIAEVAGATAHELNQPLTSMMAYASLLRRLAPEDPRVAEASERILGDAERIAAIVKHIGKVTRYETKSYVGAQRILDIEASARAAKSSSMPPSK